MTHSVERSRPTGSRPGDALKPKTQLRVIVQGLGFTVLVFRV